MGCGSSNSSQLAAEPEQKQRSASVKSTTTSEIEDLIGKKIPKLLVQPESKHKQTIDNEEQLKIDSQLGPAQPPPEDVVRAQKKQQKKYRGGDDVNHQIHENVTRIDREMQQSDIDLIRKSFKGHFVFFSLPEDQIAQLIEHMFYCTLKANQFIFKQGDQASSYFVIERGSVEIIINDKQIRTLTEGSYFGEIALLYNATRSASIRTLTDCGFWSLDRSTFKKTIEELMLKEYDENRKFIDEVPFFSFMTSDQKDSIAHALITTKFVPGQAIVNEGDQADSFYVIKSGEVSVLKGTKEIRKMGAKDSFGEQALYEKSKRGATCVAETEVKCVALGRENLTKILGDKVQIIIFSNIMRWSFEKSEVLKQLSKIQLEKIAQRAKIDNYKKGQVILEAGKACDKLIVVLEGVMTNAKQDSVPKGLCFGDQFLMKEKYGQIIESQYEMVRDGVLATISYQSLFKIFGGDLETALKKNENSHEKKIKQLGERADASHISVEDLIYIKKLGEGQFGMVYLVKHKSINKVFALKSVSKASIIEQNLEKHILQEKTVLEQCNFPFIMGFIRTFKDDISIYFLVEYIRGMELFDVIRDMGLLTKYDTQFYVATMILALEYLHSKSIVYRDLKPENIMVNDAGYMYLIDLGTAKPLIKSRAYRTYTIIGTPHYMAPEIILGKGYSFNVDLWSMGICMYEFMCGGVPYAEEQDDPYEIYEEIMNTQLKFPTFIRDRQAKKFMEQLLSKQPETRLGSSFSALKANPWFDDFDFDKLFSRELQKVPYVPPKDRMISEHDIEKKFQQGKPVVQEIKQEQSMQKQKYKKELAKDPNWDKDF
ncbi:unnamed protein product [Paramecium primaurelia]|uniref:cGMP-dependent protein kinase n=1 Tax=Paramecium primaurelia TaxID=5886 RepID=A0A8S1M4K1_PARPR|nr:unnamed protein product [Paramecium primaurelia]